MKEGMFWYLERDRIRCKLCLRKCLLKNNEVGFCKVRKVKNNKLYTENFSLVKYETKTIEESGIFHFYPGSKILILKSFGSNFPLNILSKKVEKSKLKELSPEKIIEIAKRNKVRSIIYADEEPFMFIETVYRTGKLAYREGIKNVLITNSFVSTDVIKNISKYFSAVLIKVVNSLNENFYQKYFKVIDVEELKKSIKYFKKQRFFIEIENIFVEDNETDFFEAQREFCEWVIENLGANVPYHISTIENKIEKLEPMDLSKLSSLYNDALYLGLRYVYLNNFVGCENTSCYNCQNIVIRRENMKLRKILLEGGRCPHCHTKIDVIG